MGELTQIGPLLVATTLVTCVVVAAGTYRRTGDLFHPAVFWTAYYSFFMCTGYFVNLSVGAFLREFHVDLIGTFICLGYFSFLGGLWLQKRLSRACPPVRIDPQLLPIVKERLFVLFFVSLVAGLAFYYFRGEILFFGGAEMNRFEAIAGWGYLFQLMMSFLFFVQVSLAASWYFDRKPERLTYLLIGIAFLFIAATMNRGPVLWLVLGVLLCHHYLVRAVQAKRAILCAIGLIAFAAIVGNVREGRGWGMPDLQSRFTVESRIHIQNMSHHIALSDEIGTVGIQPVLMSIKIFAPGPQPDFATWLMMELGLKTIPSTTLIGEGYLSARVPGVILSFLILGMGLGWIYGRFQYARSLRHLVIYMLILFSACGAVNYGFHKVFNSTMINVVLTLLVIPAQRAHGARIAHWAGGYRLARARGATRVDA